ncbi:MAG TPA: class I SAM-dependent methyltransferase [Candidatus Cybelea sp.]|nr:class I SAM-dependent methyltransferase [Candidatus Cybelea sp.]
MTAHPLAVRLAEHLRGGPEIRVLEFASGAGRNTRALREAGLEVVTIDDPTAASAAPLAGLSGSFAAAVSTHGLLHGTPAVIRGHVAQIARLLAKNARLYATFGSIHDARFGQGERIDASTFAPAEGNERGVAHGFFDREQLAALLGPHFTIESLEEHAAEKVHWFVVARRL